MTELTLTFLGTSAATPTVRRGLSALSVFRGGDSLLFDCGEGTQRQMMRFGGLKAPRAIFITHAHGDHWGGLPGLFSTLDMNEHRSEILLSVPAVNKGKIKSALQFMGGLPKFVNIVGFEPGDRRHFTDAGGETYTVTPFATDHSHGSQGYVLTEPERPGRFDPNIAVACGIQPGPDFKRLQNGETVKGLEPEDVIGPPRRGRKVVITGDTGPQGLTAQQADSADVLIHEATFENEREDRARRTHHSTGGDAGYVAAQALGLDRLVLTHFSQRSNPTLICQQAASHFSPVVAAHDGMKLTIPLES